MSDGASERRLVTVDGIDGSGKSTLARALAAALGPGALLFGVDEFRRPVDWSRTDRAELDLYYDERYDLPALDRCLERFLAGASDCRVPIFDSSREQVTGERQVGLEGRRWAVVEGVFVARLQAARRGLSVFVDLPRETARGRIERRDVAAGRDLVEVRRRMAERYFPAHDRYLRACDPQARAHLVIDTRGEGFALTRAAWPPDPGWAPVRAALDAVIG